MAKKSSEISLEELLEVGAHLGHRRQRWNPKMSPYIFGVQEGVHIFDLEKTREGLIAAIEELKKRAASGEVVLFIGTKQQAQDVVRNVAESLGFPYITEHWIGGLFTNFAQVQKSIKSLSDMKQAREAGEYKKFTKKEQVLLDRKITKLERIFGGVANLSKLPDAVFVVDTRREETAVSEASRVGITVFAIVDTNSDPSLVDFPIPANDDSVKSVEYIVGKVGEALTQGKKNKKVEKVEDSESVKVTMPVS